MLFAGFGIAFLFLVVLLPASLLFLIAWGITRKSIYGKLLGLMWASVIGLIVFLYVLSSFYTKMEVTQNKIYGDYVIDRDMFAGEQADWQYDNFKFKITKDDQMHFSYRVSPDAYKTEVFPIRINTDYYSDRLVLGKDTTRHHIIQDNPTLYRDVWSFYYVFNSDKFGNVFFKKKSLFGN